MPTLHLDLTYDPSEVVRLLEAVETFAEPFDVPQKPLHHFLLAVEEITLNAILYGRPAPDAEGPKVTVMLENGDLACEIIDSGQPFNPFTDAPKPDLTRPLAERQIGGLGVHLTKELIDAYSYKWQGGRNRTMLRKHLS